MSRPFYLVHMLIALIALLTLPMPADTVRARLTGTIAELDPPIGEISGLAIDPQGRIYLSDLQEPRILVFSAGGKLLATIGRKGQGPGEFTAPTGPVFGADGALYVRNLSRVLRFVPPATGEIAKRYDRAFDGPVMSPWRSKLPSVIDGAGRFYFPMYVGLSDGLTHYWYQRYQVESGTYLDSLPVPIYPTSRSEWASAPVSPGTGRMIKGVNIVPFHPVPRWTVTRQGTILSSAADKSLLIETGVREAPVRRFELAGGSMAIPAAERAESLQALNRRLDSIPVALTQVSGMSEEVKARKLPTVYPAVRALQAVGDETWVWRWSTPAARKTTVIDVVSPEGKPLRTIVLPAVCEPIPALAVTAKNVACMTVDAESGMEGVAIFRLP